MSWVSRQDDSARAFMLFGDRIPEGALKLKGVPRSLVEDGNAYDAVLDLAERIGVLIVPGRAEIGHPISRSSGRRLGSSRPLARRTVLAPSLDDAPALS